MTEERVFTPENICFESWDQFFMSMAFFVGMKSKDRSTKVGAIIATPEHRLVSMGYNGFPKGTDDDDPALHERPRKYLRVIHAERNAMNVAEKSKLAGSTLYTPWLPCAHCAADICQNDITEVVYYYSIDEGMPNWTESIREGLDMMSQKGVLVRQCEDEVYDKGILVMSSGRIARPRRKR